MRDFDYAMTPAKLLTPEMVQMIARIHEYKGRQDILTNIYKDEDSLPEDIENGKDPDYQSVYRLICSNYLSITPAPQEFLQIHRKLMASRPQMTRQTLAESEDDGTFDLHVLLKNRDSAGSSGPERTGSKSEAAGAQMKKDAAGMTTPLFLPMATPGDYQRVSRRGPRS